MAHIKVKLISGAMLSMVLGLAFASAQAAVINCKGGTCDGTSSSDTITGTAGVDNIHGLAGSDFIRGLASNDSCGGGGGNDIIECGAGKDYHQGGPNDDTLDGSLDGVQDTYKGGNGGADTFLYNTTQSGPDRVLDFNEGGATPGDVVKLTTVTTDRLMQIYSNTLEAGDPGVTKSNGNLVIDFTPVSGTGSDTLTLIGLANSSLAVGTDIQGAHAVINQQPNLSQENQLPNLSQENQLPNLSQENQLPNLSQDNQDIGQQLRQIINGR
jgi:Ca2+-binding RTX toxin-like protein